ncbi:MAG: NAD(P)-dependent oxidoreductase [Thermomicrobiales bacterium]
MTNPPTVPAEDLPRIVFLDRGVFHVPFPAPAFDHAWVEYAATSNDDVVDRLRDATVAITDGVPISRATIEASPRLRLIAVAATGYDQIDLAACADHDITVCNVRDWAVSVPEHVFALMLALWRQLPSYQRAIAAGEWQRSPAYAVVLDPLPLALTGSTLGLVGYGVLGQRVETIARAFGMNVLIAERRGREPRPGRTAFAAVLAQADVLVLVCPLTAETRGLIGARELAVMKADALLVNCARGAIVDEAALLAALRSGAIAGAGVDVLPEEPPTHGSPLLDADLPNLIVTPHVAWVSRQSQERLAREVIANLDAWWAGSPRNVVSRSRR